MKPITDCCAEWTANITKVNAPFLLAAARNPGLEYDGVPFRFCPWCGKIRQCCERDTNKDGNCDRHAETERVWPLDAVRQREVLVNAHRMIRTQYKGRPLWVFIRELTGHGSGYSGLICSTNGWSADQDGALPLI